jgi:peptidoglycan/xylan/chitin deacetylase (PgdA/CDA1 family)
MLRTLIKSAVSQTLARSGATRILSKGRFAPVVLGYHRVVRDFARDAQHSIPAMLVSVEMLEQQLDWVGRRFQFVTLDEVARQIVSGERETHPIAAVTFDDGYRDVYLNAFPLLRRKGIPAAVFVVTDLVGKPVLQRHDIVFLLIQKAFDRWPAPAQQLTHVLQRLGISQARNALVSSRKPFDATTLLLDTLSRPEIDRVIDRLAHMMRIHPDDLEPLYSLDWPMIEEMHRAGFTIGSHTRSHALLTRETHATVAEELRTSRLRLESELHAPVEHLAYPDGRFDDAVVRAAITAGYRYAYTICSHRHVNYPLMTIPRRMLWERSCVDTAGHFSSNSMECQIAGAFDWLAPCPHDHSSAHRGEQSGTICGYERLEHS